MSNDPKKYDLVITGSGPAGLTASIYAARYRLATLVIGDALGGMAGEAYKICNFPSEKEISGLKLMEKMKDHAESLGVEIILDEVSEVKKTDKEFLVSTINGLKFQTKTIILATGQKRRKLNLKQEKKFLGKGVSYCATCDGAFYKEKTVGVIGGRDAAVSAAIFLAGLARKVYLIYRGPKLRAETILVEELEKNPKIEVLYETQVVSLEGKDELEKVVLDKPYNGSQELSLAGLFVEIGSVPDTAMFQRMGIAIDEKQRIIVDASQATSLKGVWSAGDVTNGSNGLRQVITACGEGAIAAESVIHYFQTSR